MLSVQRAIAKKITGHSTDSQFDRYNIVDENDLADAKRKVDAHLSTPQQGPASLPSQKQASVPVPETIN